MSKEKVTHDYSVKYNLDTSGFDEGVELIDMARALSKQLKVVLDRINKADFSHKASWETVDDIKKASNKVIIEVEYVAGSPETYLERFREFQEKVGGLAISSFQRSEDDARTGLHSTPQPALQ